MTDTTYQYVSYRGHSLNAVKFYNLKSEVSDTGEILSVVYAYPSGWTKGRRHKDKSFFSTGKVIPELFGQDKFSAGSAQAITITEGEEDAVSVFEMLGSKYPAVSVTSSATAARDCTAQKTYLDSFDKIYLCFDNDPAGLTAMNRVAALFPFNKIYIVKKTKYKDANEYLQKGAAEEYRKCWYNARHHNPENIISSFESIGKILENPPKLSICDFPFKGLQDATFGIRTGETYLFKALEGIGKTEFMGAIEHHVIKETSFPVGIFHLEEDVQRTVQRLVNYELKIPIHLEQYKDVPIIKILETYKTLVKDDDRVHFYKEGRNDLDVDGILASIRFMAAAYECKIVFVDHISRFVSGIKLDDERRELDRIATVLSKLALELNFALLMITHVNDDHQTRGSRNIGKEAWTVTNLYRDKLHADPLIRNTTNLVIEKNRHVGITGPVDSIYFDTQTFTLSNTIPKLLP